MIKIEHLSDKDVDAISINAAVPATDKLVIVQAIVQGKVMTIGARYRNGKWFGEGTGDDLTGYLLDAEQAIWMESRLFPESACHTTVNT